MTRTTYVKSIYDSRILLRNPRRPENTHSSRSPRGILHGTYIDDTRLLASGSLTRGVLVEFTPGSAATPEYFEQAVSLHVGQLNYACSPCIGVSINLERDSLASAATNPCRRSISIYLSQPREIHRSESGYVKQCRCGIQRARIHPGGGDPTRTPEYTNSSRSPRGILHGTYIDDTRSSASGSLTRDVLVEITPRSATTPENFAQAVRLHVGEPNLRVLAMSRRLNQPLARLSCFHRDEPFFAVVYLHIYLNLGKPTAASRDMPINVVAAFSKLEYTPGAAT